MAMSHRHPWMLDMEIRRPPFGPVWDPVHLVARQLLRALVEGPERDTGTLDRP